MSRRKRFVREPTYTLKKTEKQERSIEGEYTQPVSAFDEYDHPVGAGDVPQTKTVSVLNQKTGQNQDVVCTFSGISTAGSGGAGEPGSPSLFRSMMLRCMSGMGTCFLEMMRFRPLPDMKASFWKV